MAKILIVEDDLDIQELLQNFLQEAGYEVSIANDGVEAVSLFSTAHYDLILLDVMLPKIDGFTVCELIRKQSQIPIIMLTALSGEKEQIKGLDLQVDDYITKPFSIAVLKLRLKKLLEREVKGESRENRMASGNLCMDLKMMKVLVDREELECSMTEFKLLKFFLENRGQVLTQNQILEAVWDLRGRYVNANTLQVNVGRLRKKLEAAGCTAQVKTIHGIGYLWEEA